MIRLYIKMTAKWWITKETIYFSRVSFVAVVKIGVPLSIVRMLENRILFLPLNAGWHSFMHLFIECLVRIRWFARPTWHNTEKNHACPCIYEVWRRKQICVYFSEHSIILILYNYKQMFWSKGNLTYDYEWLRTLNSGLALWIGSLKDMFDMWRHLDDNWERKDWISCGGTSIQKPIVRTEKISSKNWMKVNVSESSCKRK